MDLSKLGGSGSIPIGGTVMLPDFFQNKIEQDGYTYLRSGYVETDEAQFDTEFFNFPFIEKAKPTTGISYGGSQQYSNTAYLRGKYWVMGQKSGGGVGLFSSANGLAFTEVSLTSPGSSVSVYDLLDSGTMLLAMPASTESGAAYYWTSTDGNAFTARLSPFWGVSNANGGGLERGGCYFGGYFYCSGRTASNAYDLKRSADGINWASTGKNNVNIGQHYPIAGATNMIMLTPSLTGPKSVESTTNGTSWSTVYTFPATDDVGLMGYMNGKFVARITRTLGAGIPQIKMVATSSDGAAWEFFDITNEPVNLGAAEPALRYLDGLYFATNAEVDTIAVSRDLKKWVKRSISNLGNGFKPYRPAAGNGKLVFIDSQQYDYSTVCVENFSGTQYYAGAPNYFEQGSTVQYMRIK